MEVDDIESQQQQATEEYSRLESSKMGVTGGGGMNGGGGEEVGSRRFGRHQWQQSSRIIRVSRASGGKDRHSKVWTAKGARDRRVRLSVTTAIQFYDLQDRLGYDQPSKAVEWLIKAAAGAINELPSLDTANFPPQTPRQLSDERSNIITNNGGVDPAAEGELHGHQLQQVGKSGSSSNNSETSKGSGLSLSRSENRAKARERTALKKESEATRVSVAATHAHSHSHSMPQTSSFTQLLTAGISNLNENNAAASSSPSPHHGSSSSARGRSSNAATTDHLQWLSSNCTTPMADYFETGLMGLSTTRPNHLIQHLPTLSPFGGGSHTDIHHHHHQHHQQQHFPFMADPQPHHHLIQVPNNTAATTGAGTGPSGGGDYNLNFSISSSSSTTSGFNRGTLQSNSSSSPSLLSYLHRYSATDGVSSLPFFLGGAPISPQHHHHNATYDPPGLQLCYGDGGRHSDQKPKREN